LLELDASRARLRRPSRQGTLQRLETLAGSARIDHQGLNALCDEVERARRAGVLGQQLARLASGQLRQTHERLALAQALQGALT